MNRVLAYASSVMTSAGLLLIVVGGIVSSRSALADDEPPPAQLPLCACYREDCDFRYSAPPPNPPDPDDPLPLPPCESSIAGHPLSGFCPVEDFCEEACGCGHVDFGSYIDCKCH